MNSLVISIFSSLNFYYWAGNNKNIMEEERTLWEKN